ncbi:MAG: hypothetical protein JWM90_2669 [Thermoleophilia bacterium]|nr:hypothetical protein [Thermoleophilia bacterium]
MYRRIALIVTVLLAVLLAAGCGGGPNKDDYEAGLRGVQAHLDDAKKASDKASGELDADKRNAAIRDQDAALKAAAAAADKLDPPEDAEKANAKFVKALGAYADLFGKLVEANGDSEQEAALVGEAGPIVDDLQEANTALAKAGYKATSDKE